MLAPAATPALESLRADLEGSLGAAAVLVRPEDKAGYLTDWSGDWTGDAVAVARPGSVAEVQACVDICRRHGIGIVPQGGNSGLVGAGFPPASGQAMVIVSLSRLNAIRRADAANATLDLDAGCTLQMAKDAAEAIGLQFPLALGAQGSCQVGGNAATNAGGVNVLRFGMARDLILGLEAVLPDGSLWSSMRGLRKDNRGYDLKQLFIGSEGTLGIVTGLCLKLHPKPATIETAYLGVGSVEDAMAISALARGELSELVTAFEIIGTECLALTRLVDADLASPVSPAFPVHVLIELSCGRRLDGRALLEGFLADMIAQGLASDAVVAQSGRQARRFWAIREGLVEGQARRGYHVRSDVSVRLGDVPAFVAAARAFAARDWPDWVPQVYGHAGDGNIHFNLLPPIDMPRRDAQDLGRRITAGLFAIVEAFHGSISAEHGIGRARTGAFWDGLSEVERRTMRAVKDALDPLVLMNPGCLIPLAEEKA
ncbi:FAD-binding oxidoreductase [Aquibium sp. ELW1220]|uniref:FAD-binding oxidoreductase n=1 Tax=Aquibium sp. ELW1220 TaxID=2976766 RepID=UPI0025B211FC|nr:FAD-binding oxidoreductase [Aquibium sp. ELW1220]MDN2580896.1 FAD-binding oxidoreductase [Aquibium sp. ELW1220]